MGPTWVLSSPGGPHVGPMNLAIWGVTLRKITQDQSRNTRTSLRHHDDHRYPAPNQPKPSSVSKMLTQLYLLCKLDILHVYLFFAVINIWTNSIWERLRGWCYCYWRNNFLRDITLYAEQFMFWDSNVTYTRTTTLWGAWLMAVIGLRSI